MKRSPLLILFITAVIDLLGFGIIFPLLPVYVQKYGGTPVVAGLLTTSYSIAQFIFSPIWGRASDRYGRRPLILLSLFGSAVAFLIFGLADSLWVLFAARIGGGILTAASMPTLYAYIADVTPPEKRASGMAMIGVAFGIGFAFGPWIGAVLGSENIRVPAFFVAGMACVNFVFAFLALPESHHPEDGPQNVDKRSLLDVSAFASAFTRPVLGKLLTLFSVQNFAMAILEATFTWLVLVRFLGVGVAGERLTPYQESRAAEMVGPVFGIVGVSVMIVQGAMMGGLAHRIGERRLVWIGALTLSAAMFWIGAAHSMFWLKVASVFVAAGSGILHPSLSSLTSQVAGASEKGSVMGVQQGVGSLARMIAPPLGTWLLQRFGTATPFYASGALMLVAFLLSLGLPAIQVEAKSESLKPSER